ncbi:MAG: methyltransferase [Rikenellaceae bacterium]|nr:methyltransferase [Rikenellaceae bacterium]MDE7355376.1 methyltransferase [Rikenellaceae bacterium]
MANKYFRFKQFTVRQEHCAMKVGTDGVLLGSWATVTAAATRILDIGTGTGLIALMAAQRAPVALVDAIEIEEEASSQAGENFESSPWSDRLSVYNMAIQDFRPEFKYDVILSNPPYFSRSLKSESLKKCLARHNESLPPSDLAACVGRLLDDNGSFAAILPYEEANVFIAEAVEYGLYLTRRTDIRGRRAKPVKRVLMEFAKHPAWRLVSSQMHLENEDGSRSGAYAELTREFYL